MDQQQRENRRMRVPHRSTYLYGPLSFTTSWAKNISNFRGREIGMAGKPDDHARRCFGWEARTRPETGSESVPNFEPNRDQHRLTAYRTSLAHLLVAGIQNQIGVRLFQSPTGKLRQ